jgi:hypothetical protein
VKEEEGSDDTDEENRTEALDPKLATCRLQPNRATNL